MLNSLLFTNNDINSLYVCVWTYIHKNFHFSHFRSSEKVTWSTQSLHLYLGLWLVWHFSSIFSPESQLRIIEYSYFSHFMREKMYYASTISSSSSGLKSKRRNQPIMSNVRRTINYDWSISIGLFLNPLLLLLIVEDHALLRKSFGNSHLSAIYHLCVRY